MNTEQEPITLSNNEAIELVAKGAAQIDTDISQKGLVAPETRNNLNAVNNPSERMVADDQKRYDALEAVKSGNLDGITDTFEKEALKERYENEGQKGLESLVETLQKKVTKGTIDTDKLAGYVAEQHLGENAKGTLRMKIGKLAAKQGIDGALEPATIKTLEDSQ